MKFTNYTAGPKGVHTTKGLVYVGPGQTSDDLDVSEGEAAAAKATGWFDMPQPTAAPEPATELVAKHRGGGSYSVMRGDDEVVDKLTKGQAEAFNALSDEDKALAVEAHTAGL